MENESPKRKRGKRKLGLKQKKLVKALTKANSVAEAGRMAGYGTRESTHRALKSVQEKMPEIMDRFGLTDEYLVEHCLKPGLTAMETKFFQKDGLVMEEKDVIAWGTRRDFLDMAFKVKGVYKVPDYVGDAGNHAAQIGFRVVVSDTGRAAAIAGILSAGRPDNVVIDVDATVHTNVGRTGPGKPEQAIP